MEDEFKESQNKFEFKVRIFENIEDLDRKKIKMNVVGHTCNPSMLGGWGRRTENLSSTQAN